MRTKDISKGTAIAFVLVFLALQILFQNMGFSSICGLIISILFLPIYKKNLIKKEKNILLMQFKDFLESLASSYSAGKNTQNAFNDVLEDMRLLYNDESNIFNETNSIVIGMENGYTIEILLDNFAKRSGVEDIKNFADIFNSCNRTGGNLKAVINETKDIINEKIEIEMDIKATIAEKKTELYIMLTMPFVITLALNFLGDRTFSASNPINIIIRSIVMCTVIFAYFLGNKITDISV